MALTQIKTDAISDDAVTLAKQAAGTDGQIITYDASGNPTAVGPGTDGQVLTSTGAGSPPAFETLPTSGATLSGSTDNTVVTVTGSNAMQGEANLKFDGNNLGIGTAPSHLLHVKKDTGSGAAGTKVVIENAATDSVNNNVELYLKTSAGDFGFKHYNATESYMMVPDALIINTNTANSAAQAVHIDTSQNVKVSNGNLVIGTSGKGIDFSATGDGSGTDSSELLADYEEGTFTPTMPNSGSASFQTINEASYTKIGRRVWANLSIRLQPSNSNYAVPDNSTTFQIGGFPYAASNYGGGSFQYTDGANIAGSGLEPLIWTSNAIAYFHWTDTDTTAATNAWFRSNMSNKTFIFQISYIV